MSLQDQPPPHLSKSCIRILDTPSPVCDYVIFERCLSWFVDNFLITFDLHLNTFFNAIYV